MESLFSDENFRRCKIFFAKSRLLKEYLKEKNIKNRKKLTPKTDFFDSYLKRIHTHIFKLYFLSEKKWTFVSCKLRTFRKKIYGSINCLRKTEEKKNQKSRTIIISKSFPKNFHGSKSPLKSILQGFKRKFSKV